MSNFQRPPMEEVKCFESTEERKQAEELADFYSIFRATESIEIAYQRDAIAQDSYTEACTKLIGQFRDAERTLLATDKMRDTAGFIGEYHLRVDCPKAVYRLVIAGVPATEEHVSKQGRDDQVHVFDTTSAIITALDTMKMDFRAVDQILPPISDICTLLGRVRGMKPGLEPMLRMNGWLQKLSSMRAVDVLDEDQARQLSLDLDTSYSDFKTFLSTHK